MFVKRTAELKLLEEQYGFPGSNLVILYGRKGQGKTTLLTEFMEGKPAFYYEGVECVEQMQLYRIFSQIAELEDDTQALNFPFLFSTIIREQKQKQIIVLDEFHFIVKNSPNFPDAFELLSNPKQPVMIILCSSSIRWVENEMVGWMGTLATYITAHMKLKEFTFVDLVNRFPKATIEKLIYINAIMGGVPDYLNHWQEERSIKDNIIAILLNKDSRLFLETQQFLKQELREPAVYNTILFALAQGNHKLNDLHRITGFSRAKISVYLKHLIQLDLVEKLVPLGGEGKENVKKGLYRIKDNFLSFWYRFVFPNLSKLMLGKTNSVYDSEIAIQLNGYMGEYFSDVCTEYLKLMNLHQRLQEKFLWWDRWYGKSGTIDIMGQGQNDKMLVGICLWEDRQMMNSDYEKLLSLSKEAGLSPNYIYLFSKGGFAEEMYHFASENEFVTMIGLEDL